MCERAPSHLVELADILRRLKKQADQQIAFRLDNLLAYTSFQLNIFKRYTKTLVDCERVATKITRALVKNDGVRGVFVTGGNAKENCCVSPYLNDVAEVSQKQILFCRKKMLWYVRGGEWP